MWTIWRYIIRQHLGPFFFAFAVIFFILVLDLLLDMMDAVLGKGIDILTVIELFALNFAWMIAIAVPMAVLVSVLMAFGRMANDNEVTALMSSGVGPIAMTVPVLVIAFVLAVGLSLFNELVLPDSNHRAKLLQQSVRRQKPAITLKDREGMFISDFPSHVLRVDSVLLESGSDEALAPLQPATGSQILGVLIYEYDRSGRDPATIVTAERGTIEIWEGGAVVRLVLQNGEMVQVDAQDRTKDLHTAFNTQTIIITDPERNTNQPQTGRGYRGDRELSSADMFERVEVYQRQYDSSRERMENFHSDTTRPADQRRLLVRAEQRAMRNYERHKNRYLVEIHKHFSIPFSCVVFVLIGAPLGMMARGAGRTIAVLGSLVLFLLYWSSLISGEQFADRNAIQPWLAMWGANIVVGAIGAVLLGAVSRNVRMASLFEALPRALEARRLRRKKTQEEGTHEG